MKCRCHSVFPIQVYGPLEFRQRIQGLVVGVFQLFLDGEMDSGTVLFKQASQSLSRCWAERVPRVQLRSVLPEASVKVIP